MNPVNGELRKYGITIPANSEHPFDIAGDFIYMRVCAAEVTVRTNKGSSAPMLAGEKVRMGVFEKLRIVNDTGSAIEVEFLAGFGDFNSDRLSGSVDLSSPTGFSGLVDVSVTAGNKILLAAASATRKALSVTNTDAAISLRIGGVSAAANRGTLLAPGQSMTVESSGAVYAWNPGGLAVAVALSEVTA